jgi:hypothetical protein
MPASTAIASKGAVRTERRPRRAVLPGSRLQFIEGNGQRFGILLTERLCDAGLKSFAILFPSAVSRVLFDKLVKVKDLQRALIGDDGGVAAHGSIQSA